jgi:hypothetical protein
LQKIHRIARSRTEFINKDTSIRVRQGAAIANKSFNVKECPIGRKDYKNAVLIWENNSTYCSLRLKLNSQCIKTSFDKWLTQFWWIVNSLLMNCKLSFE